MKRPEYTKKHNKIDIYISMKNGINQSITNNDSNPLHEQTGTHVHIVANSSLYNCIYYSV